MTKKTSHSKILRKEVLDFSGEWLEKGQDQWDRMQNSLTKKEAASGAVLPSICNPVSTIGIHYGMRAVHAYAKGDFKTMGDYAWAAAQCQLLYVRIGMFGLPKPLNPPKISLLGEPESVKPSFFAEFRQKLKTLASPTPAPEPKRQPSRHNRIESDEIPRTLALSLAWDDGWAKTVGHASLLEVDRDLQYYVEHNDVDIFYKYGRGRPDYPSFILSLYKQVCNDPAPYTPKNLMPEYREILSHWRSEDGTRLIEPVKKLIPYRENIYNTQEDPVYGHYDTAFPWEFLAIQRLRHQLGLPEIHYGIDNIDIPWQVIRDYDKNTPPPEECTRAIKRIQKDYPEFPTEPEETCEVK